MRIVVPFEVKSVNEAGEFFGYGSTFDNVDLGGDVCVKGCFRESLEEHAKAGTLPSMFFNHNDNEPIGDYVEMKEDDVGLFVKGRVWVGKGIGKAEQAYQMMKGTGKKGLSIGYFTKLREMTQEGVRRLLKLDLLEVSVTPFAMNPKAGVLGCKSADGSLIDPRTLERLLRDELRMSAREAKALMSQGYAGLSGLARDADPSKEREEIIAALNNNIKALRG